MIKRNEVGVLLLFSMADSKFILYVRKFLKNPLLARKQASIELIHPNEAGVDKASIKAKLAKVLKTKEECINIFGLKAKFGGGRSSGFALIYDSVDARKRYDSKSALKRVSASLPERAKGPGRVFQCGVPWVPSRQFSLF